MFTLCLGKLCSQDGQSFFWRGEESRRFPRICHRKREITVKYAEVIMVWIVMGLRGLTGLSSAWPVWFALLLTTVSAFVWLGGGYSAHYGRSVRSLVIRRMRFVSCWSSAWAESTSCTSAWAESTSAWADLLW